MLIPYCYIIVRKDIPLCDQLVQSNHASLEAGKEFQHPPGTHIALLEVKNEKKLFKIAEKLENHGIKHGLFYEPDGENPGYTALATETIYGKDRKVFSDLNLWTED